MIVAGWRVLRILFWKSVNNKEGHRTAKGTGMKTGTSDDRNACTYSG